MLKAEKVVKFYGLCNRLKDVVRSGCKVWHVKRDRLESVAEHIYGTQMVAIVMWSEYGYEVDIEKVIMMLAVHELEEIGIGDLIPFEVSESDKNEIGHKAVEKILAGMMRAEEVENLVLEFDARETAEAKFAKACDKLEADLQYRMYDEEGCIDLMEQKGNLMLADTEVQEIAKEKGSASEIWLEYGRRKNDYDANFLEVSHYIEENGIVK